MNGRPMPMPVELRVLSVGYIYKWVEINPQSFRLILSNPEKMFLISS